MQGDLFTAKAEGKRRKKAGQTKVASDHEVWLDMARKCAVRLAEQLGSVTSDLIHQHCPPPKSAHHNIMGTVFRTKELVADGFVQSTRPEAHARVIRVYKLKETQR